MGHKLTLSLTVRALTVRALTVRALTVLALTAGTSAAEPVRLSAAAFGTQAEIEVRDLPRDVATAAVRAALHEIFEISRLCDPSGRLPGGIGALNTAAGNADPQVLEARVAELLQQGMMYCLWTSGTHGPLGGELYRLWDSPDARRLPDPSELRDAVISAACNQLSLTAGETGIHARIAAGSRVTTVGMERGFALDRAVGVLRSAGVDNAWLEIDNVFRAIGRGPEGKGWLATLPPAPGTTKPSDQIWLRDQALAIAGIEPVGDEPPIRFIDQRTGVPARGVVMVATVTELAVDADALAATLFVNDLREGLLRLGGLTPRPSVFWLLGEGKGEALESTYNWSELERVRRRF